MRLTWAFAAIALISPAMVAHGKDLSSYDLAQRAIERRAVEAVIWGMPAVNYDLMLPGDADKTAGKGTRSSIGHARSTGTTRRSRRIPTHLFHGLLQHEGRGPVVIEVPPAGDDGSINGNIVNSLADAAGGRRACRRRQGRGRQISAPAARLLRTMP